LDSDERPEIHLRFRYKNYQFPIQKCAIFCKFKENGGNAWRRTFIRRTSDTVPTCPVFSVIDAEIAEKSHF